MKGLLVISVVYGLAAAVGCGGVSSPGDGGAAAGVGGAAAGVGGATAGDSGAGGTAGGTAGAGGTPCVDIDCGGSCVGSMCGGDWTCETNVACAQVVTAYCGCDGRTFSGTSCPQRAYFFVGACSGGVSCDTSKILCKRVSPICPMGQVPSVEGSCYGPCVPATYCTCTVTSATACPSGAMGQLSSCDATTHRCAFGQP